MRRALIFMCVAGFLASCDAESSCRNEILDMSPNPNGALVAVAFSRNCGATVGNNFQVSIVHRGELPEGKGNAIILDKLDSHYDIEKLMWINNEQLNISVSKNARIFLQNDKILGVHVKYLEVE